MAWLIAFRYCPRLAPSNRCSGKRERTSAELRSLRATTGSNRGLAVAPAAIACTASAWPMSAITMSKRAPRIAEASASAFEASVTRWPACSRPFKTFCRSAAGAAGSMSTSTAAGRGAR